MKYDVVIQYRRPSSRRPMDYGQAEPIKIERDGASSGGGTRMLEGINTAIQIRLAEKQDETARTLVSSTNRVVASTSRLVRATWGLVVATGALVVAEMVLKLMGKS